MGMPGGVADGCSRLDAYFVHQVVPAYRPFALRSGLHVPTVPDSNCALPLAVPYNAIAEECASFSFLAPEAA